MKVSVSSVFILFILVNSLACERVDLGPWVEMRARQVSVPLADGGTVVEIRDEEEGWTERVALTGEIPVEERPAAAEAALDEAAVAYYLGELGPGLPRETLDRAVAVAVWTNRRVFAGSRDDTGDARPGDAADGRAVLAAVDRGAFFNCYSLATVFADAARAAGLRVRRVDLTLRHGSPYEGHSAGEVWSPELARWVLVDPWFGLRYEVGGAPASALDVHREVAAGRLDAVRVVRLEGVVGADPNRAKINPLLYYRNLYVRLADGAWLVRVDRATPPRPVAIPNAIHSDSDADFTSEGPPPPPRRGSSGGRVAFQALDGRLYVCLADGLFRLGRLRVRVSSGLEPDFSDEPRPHDPGDALLLFPGELLPAGPRDWTPVGAARVERAGDEVVAESDAGASAVELRVPVEDGVPVVAFVRLRVERGLARLAARNADTPPVAPGSSTLVSSNVSGTQKGFTTLRVELDPDTRCVVEWTSVRRVRRLGETDV
jgi:hypothetical protein